MRTTIFTLFLALALWTLAPMASSAQTPPFTRTVVVNKVGGAAANGAALLSALSSLSPAPSSGDRWVIKIEGGFYDVGTTPIVLPDFVNLEGSGIYTTIVRGSVQPPAGSNLGGLVQASNNVEIRDLTIQCLSNATVSSCQAMSLNSASPRLTDIRILSQGTGSGNHWGIRTFNSAPRLDRVQVDAKGTGGDNYGIVYGGTSTVDVKRSSIVARNGSFNNWAILLRDDTTYSTMSDTDITATGGNEAVGIRYLSSTTDSNLLLDNVRILSSAAIDSVGIGDDGDGYSTPRIFFRHGRLYGSTAGFEHWGANVDFVNTEIYGETIRVLGNAVKIGGTRLHGSGVITGLTSLVCAGNYDGSYTFYPNTCPP